MLESKILTHTGIRRESNEDAVLENESLGLWVVADGVGGNGHGDVASQMACQAIERKVRQGESLTRAIMHANETILAAVADDNDYAEMATTVVACHFDAGHFELAWVGDSRAYLIDESGICQITQDHNVANELLEQGEIDDVEARTHQGQHQLTQALGKMDLAHVPKNLGELHNGDYLLLCSDGLSGVLSDKEILDVVRSNEKLETITDVLLEKVMAAGAPDNVSISLIRYQEDDAPIKASDFREQGYRAPFDRTPYDVRKHYRVLLLALMIMSFLFLIFAL